MQPNKIRFPIKGEAVYREYKNVVYVFVLALILIPTVIYRNSAEGSVDKQLFIYLFLVVVLLLAVAIYNTYIFVEISSEGVRLLRLGISVREYKWDEIKTVGHEEIYLKTKFEPQIYMCICKKDLPVKNNFILKHNTRDYLAFAIESEQEYNKIIQYCNEDKVIFIDGYESIPKDYTTSSFRKSEFISMWLLLILAVVVLVWIFAVLKNGILMKILLSCMLPGIFILISLRNLNSMQSYGQYQIDNIGIKRISHGEIVEVIKWDEIGDIVIRNLYFGDWRTNYKRVESKIYICFEEQDVRDGKLHISNWAWQGDNHFYMEYNKRNLDLITKYYPKYMIKGPVK